ncbi:MAG: hypothetical protein GY790_04725 [Bacteroidetes bacterium]|nr:hypothetical protein [Bacteroidota bacterium]
MKPKFDSEDPLLKKLEAFQSIDIEEDWNVVRQSIGFGKTRFLEKSRRARTWFAAASIVLALGIGFLTQQYFFAPQEMIIALAGDEQEEVFLPDGSIVMLNSLAQLSYPAKFRRGKREVLLSGEAFFEVERNPQKPFIVRIEEKAMVEVLGTSFNIRSEPSGEAVTVLVVEGRVAFSDAEEELSVLFLNKDEQASLSDGILKREKAVNKNMLSWKTGILYFNQSFIGDVAVQLASHYDREILLEEDISGDLQFTSTIDNQELESVLEELSMVLGLTISYEDDLIRISNTH